MKNEGSRGDDLCVLHLGYVLHSSERTRDPSSIYYFDTYVRLLVAHLANELGNTRLRLIGSNDASSEEGMLHSSVAFLEVACGIDRFPLRSIRYLLGSVKALIQSSPSTVYLCYDGYAPYFLGAMLYSVVKRAHLIVDFRNPPASWKEDWDRPPRFIRLLTAIMDRLLVRLASFVVAISPACAEALHERMRPTDVLFVPEVAHPAFAADPEFSWDSSTPLVFCYWGSLSKSRELSALVKGFSRANLESQRMRRELLLIGEGDDFGNLRHLTETLGTDNIRVLPSLPQAELAEFLKRVHVAVVAVPRTLLIYRMSYPTKFSEAMALGKPILGTRISSMSIVEERGLGLLCDHTVDGYREAIVRFTPETLRTCVENMKKLNPSARLHQVSESLGDLTRRLAAIVPSQHEKVAHGRRSG